MAISSPLQSKVLVGSSKTIKKLQTILLNRTKVRREIFQRQTILQNRRIENERRKQREDELEAPNLVTKPRGPVKLISGSAKGFFERLMGFLSYLTAGWIINNIPTWIAMGKEFIARTQQMGKILGNFVGNITNVLTNFTKLMGASLENLIKFDFSDTSGRVSTAFDDLNLSVKNWGTDFEDAIKLITTPLTKGIASGEDAPSTGTQITDEGAYERTAPYSGSGGTVGTKEQRAMLDSIAFAEGTAKYPNDGYNTMFTGKQFSGFEDHPRKIQRSNGYASDAAGRYQFLSTTWDPLAKKLGLKDFSPANQDKAAIELARQYDVTQELLAKEGMSPKVSAFLGRQWASFPGKSIGLDQPTKGLKGIQNVYQKSLGSSQQSQTPQQSSSPQQSTPGTGQSFRPLPQGSFKGGENQRYLAPREGTRKHLGIDITESNWKRGTDPRIPVVAIRGGVVSSRDYVGGTEYLSGMVIDQDDGYSVRYLHMTPSVRPGQKVSAGQRIGRLVDLGDQTHLHIELYSGSKRLDPTDYIKTVERGGVPPSIARQQSPTPSPAQITPTGTPQNPQISKSLAQERTGPTVIVSQNPEPVQQMMYSGGGGYSGGGSSQISDFALLNNFIKNKLLLDLAYL